MRDAQWGFGSSPVIMSDRVLVQCDVQSGSFVAALSLEDGRDVWRAQRDEVPTWSTPTVVEHEGRAHVVCNGYRHIGAYDLQTGEEIWRFAGGGDIPVPTPVVGHGLVFITNAHGRMAPIYAVELDARGTIADPFASEYIAWAHPRRGIYMQTPIVYGDHLYCCNDAGVLGCYVAKTGDELYRERLGTGQSGFTASGVAADGKLYFPSEVGEVHVVKAGGAFERISVNDMREECMASPAVAEGVIYFRTRRHVVAVGAPGAP
jgi:outer membrane protein assembly factor BamB